MDRRRRRPWRLAGGLLAIVVTAVALQAVIAGYPYSDGSSGFVVPQGEIAP